MSSETDEAIVLANRILDRPNADPDDDLAILARQFLRSDSAYRSIKDTLYQSEDRAKAAEDRLSEIEEQVSDLIPHPDHTSPMTMVPEIFYDDELDALRQRCRWAENNARLFQHECRMAQDENEKLKADLRSWEITAKRVAEADFLDLSLAPERSAAAIARDALAGKQVSEYAERATADTLYWKQQAEAASAILAKVRKIRDGYADQAKFADVDPASYFREFVRRLDQACLVQS
ncbi:MAG: hypothetical protein EKK41_05120 [Hyphomicrobiales bacterium]|nr:MAG: hypothetical protein EKK41_05120 [Hyphomicrobiales bacterium]